VSAKDQVCRPSVNTYEVIKEAVFKTSRNSKATAFDANRYLSDSGVSGESAYEDLDIVNLEAKLPKDFNMENDNWSLKSIPSLAVSNKQISPKWTSKSVAKKSGSLK